MCIYLELELYKHVKVSKIGALGSLFAIVLAAPAYGQSQDFGLVSPCPFVFMYEPLGAEPGKWYGNINLSTETTLYALWLNIVVDSKADILGNWVGEVTTDNNLDFKIENTNMKISPEAPLSIRFFIQYNVQNKPPKLLNIRFNGREICKVENNRVTTKTDVITTTIRPAVTTKRITERQQTTKSQYWQEKSKTRQTTQKPLYFIQATTESNRLIKTEDKNQSSTKETTVRPTLWPQVFSQVVSDSKKQTAVDKPSTVQTWSQTKVVNNQQVKSDSRQQTQTTTETKTQPLQPVSNWQESGTENKQKTQEDVIMYWPKIPVTETAKRPETKFVIDNDDTPQNQGIRDRPIYERPRNKNQSANRERQPESTYIVVPIKTQDDIIGKWPIEQPSRWSEGSQSNNGRVIFESAGDRSTKFGQDQSAGSRGNQHTSRYHATTAAPSPVTEVSEIDDFDSVDSKKDDDAMYHFGGLPTIFIPAHAANAEQAKCGKVLLNKADEYNDRRTSAIEGQWPWQIALYQQQTTVDFKYICGGTLVSRRHVITAAHCVCRKGSRKVVNKNTLTVYLGKYNLRTSVEGVQVTFVNKITVHPSYNASTYSRDLAILELRETVTYSPWVQPACLWPETETDLNSIIGKKGSVVGWGFEASGIAREELNLLEMPIVNQDTCIGSQREFYSRYTSSYTYCAGYGTSSCNGDSGGGMVFKRDESWYLRGLVSLSIARRNDGRCDQDHYVIFTDIAKLLPWVEDNLDDY